MGAFQNVAADARGGLAEMTQRFEMHLKKLQPISIIAAEQTKLLSILKLHYQGDHHMSTDRIISEYCFTNRSFRPSSLV